MSTDIIREFLAVALSTMTSEEMKHVFMNTPDKDLETVGAAILVEKRKKTTPAVQPGAQIPVDNMEGAGEGEPVTKVAKISKTVSKKAVAKKPVKKASARLSGPSKRTYDTMDLTSDTDGETSKSIGEENEERFDPTYPQGQYATPDNLQTHQGITTNPLRYRLNRLAKIMDVLDWKRIQCRADLIRHLFQGDGKMFRPRANANSVIATQEDMARFIDEHQAKFQYHTMFTAAYRSTIEGPNTFTKHHQADSRGWTHRVTIPSYDWEAVTRHLGLLDYFGKRVVVYEHVQDFCSFYEGIIQQYITYPSGHPDIQEIVGSVNLMSVLAANMSSATSRELKYELRGDEPMSNLQDCMAILCSALAKLKLVHVSTVLDKQGRQKVGSQLRMVDRMLRGKYPLSSFKSGIEKVEHLF